MTTTIIDVGQKRTRTPGRRLPSVHRRPPRAPRPPKRTPPPPRERAPLSPTVVLVRSSFTVLALLLLAFVLNVTVFSQIQHVVAQQQLANEFREELVAGTAPVSEGDFNDHLLADGAPLGILSIPSIGVREVFIEGTSADTMKNGPGHRRDTVLPGQVGVSVLLGRAAAFGGPFGRIQELAPGDTFSIRTGQGESVFTVIGVRYAGDPAPAAPTLKQSRLILETARGASFAPDGVAYVDAQAAAKPAGARQTTFLALPSEDKPMASDVSTVWALVFALQFMVIAEIAAVWSYRKLGAQKTWVVFVPVTILAVLFVTNQVTILLPNLL